MPYLSSHFLAFLTVGYTNPEYKDKLSSISIPSLPDYVVPDFSKMELSLKEFSFPEFSMPEIKLPNISIADLSSPFNISMPEIPSINITVPEFPAAYYKYKSATADTIRNIYDYVKTFIIFMYNELHKLIAGAFAPNTPVMV